MHHPFVLSRLTPLLCTLLLSFSRLTLPLLLPLVLPGIRRRLGSYYIHGHAQNYCDEFDTPYQLCMKKWAKLSGDPEKRRDAYIRYRAEWATERRMGPSSEDVWKVRK